MAQGLWALLIPHGLQGGALSHKREDGEDDAMGIDEDGWQEEYLNWWFEHLKEKGVKGVSKDVWQMVSFPLFLSDLSDLLISFTVPGICPHH